MALSEAIQREIARLSSLDKQQDIFAYLKPMLVNGDILPQDVHEYVYNYFWSNKPGSPPVVNADIINLIGVVISGLSDDKKPWAAQFYFLAAQRGNAWGCRNYAACALLGVNGAEKSNQVALDFAKKAIALSPDFLKNQFMDIYAQALDAEGQYSLSLTAMVEYLGFVVTKQNQENNIKNALIFCNQSIDRLIADFQGGMFAQEQIPALLLALQSLIACPGNHQELPLIRSKAYFLTGQFYKFLKMNSNAWLAYCQANEKGDPFYEKMVGARKELLKNFITQQFDNLIVSAALPVENLVLDENAKVATEPAKKPEETLLLPNGIPLSLNFSKFWNKNTLWFHSVDEEAAKKLYEKRCKQINILFEAKKEDIALVDKAIKKRLLEPNEAESKKTALQNELLQLQQARTEIERRYRQQLIENRNKTKRHQVETRFFDPRHLKKQAVLEKLRQLTLDIIDRRFSLENAMLPPLNLAGISSRMLITAERVFQEAVIELSGGPTRVVVLGIPRARGSHWAINGYSGTNWLGIVERYQVANTEIQAEHRTSPKRHRLGDSFMPQHGAYPTDIYPFFRKLADNKLDNEKQIAIYLIRYSKAHQAVTLDELRNFYQDADESDVNRFNQIAFLIMEKEQSQWHSAIDESYQLGMSVAQARALRMLEAGFLRLDEVFSNNILFSVYSQSGIYNSPAKVAEACGRIDEFYTNFVLHQHQNESMRFFKLQVGGQKKRVPVLTCEQAHMDLQYVYGGETDSEGEDYDSERVINQYDAF